MSQSLFVYGSLMTALAHSMGARLRSEATLLGRATMAGQLYRVSWYPGVRPAEAAGDIVHGELYALHDANRTLDWLDDYEGVKPGKTSVAASDEYARAEQMVTSADGTTRLSWVYLYLRPLPAAARVVDGVWRG